MKTIRNLSVILAVAISSAAALATPPATITKGGLYTNLNVQGTATEPAISILTTEPVIITNSTISFKADGIQCLGVGAQVLVLGCHFLGQNPDVEGKFTQCAIDF